MMFTETPFPTIIRALISSERGNREIIPSVDKLFFLLRYENRRQKLPLQLG